MNNNPKVTIILATYNRAHLIMETLVSIKDQTYENWECLIIDDGWRDETNNVILSMLEIDNRFQYVKRHINYKKGLPGCRNYGLDLAKGKYVIFFDDDDIVHPQNLELCTGFLESNKSNFCVYKKQSFTGSFTGTFVNQSAVQDKEIVNLFNFIINKVPIASCTVMWQISCFDKIRFNEDLMYAEEWECYSRILTTNKNGALLNNILYFNRKHTESNTGEFWNNDPIRRTSKVKAAKLIITNLVEKRILDYRLAVYFMSLAHFLKEDSIYEHLMKYKNSFGLTERLKLYLRYHGNFLIKPVYKLKKRFT
jgi:GalNAc5-diNAcBac-PP-undecaprenol beta-1,3-glucosyltransferase